MNADIATKYGVGTIAVGIPAFVLLDRQGNIVKPRNEVKWRTARFFVPEEVLSDLLDVSPPTIRRMADADLSPALRDRQLLEGARTCLAETAGRGSTVEEREAAVVWLQEAARDERQQVAAARRKIAAVSLRKLGMRRDAVGTQRNRRATGFRPRRSLEQVSRCSADGSRAILARPRRPQ